MISPQLRSKLWVIRDLADGYDKYHNNSSVFFIWGFRSYLLDDLFKPLHLLRRIHEI